MFPVSLFEGHERGQRIGQRVSGVRDRPPNPGLPFICVRALSAARLVGKFLNK